MKVPFGDLSKEYKSISSEINESVDRVLSSGWFILGREVEKFENEFAKYIEAKYCIGCANGTDAITLSLLALGLNPDDEVITQTNTCIPSVCGIANANVKPQFCDVEEDSLMLDVTDLSKRITGKTKVIMPVNLYGASANYDDILNLTKEKKLTVIEDCAQSHGSVFKGKKTGNFGLMSAFSFYPSKNLGAYGDGGAVVTNDEELYNKLLMLRNYGQEKRYYHSVFGLNSRLDEIQAATLSVKLKYLDEWNNRRKEIANIYNNHFKNDRFIKPLVYDNNINSVYHLYIIKVPRREELQKHLENKGVSTLIHYPIPAHLQKAYSYLGYKTGDFPVAEKNAREILSLPMYPQLTDDEVNYTALCVKEFYER